MKRFIEILGQYGKQKYRDMFIDDFTSAFILISTGYLIVFFIVVVVNPYLYLMYCVYTHHFISTVEDAYWIGSLLALVELFGSILIYCNVCLWRWVKRDWHKATKIIDNKTSKACKERTPKQESKFTTKLTEEQERALLRMYAPTIYKGGTTKLNHPSAEDTLEFITKVLAEQKREFVARIEKVKGYFDVENRLTDIGSSYVRGLERAKKCVEEDTAVLPVMADLLVGERIDIPKDFTAVAMAPMMDGCEGTGMELSRSEMLQALKERFTGNDPKDWIGLSYNQISKMYRENIWNKR